MPFLLDSFLIIKCPHSSGNSLRILCARFPMGTETGGPSMGTGKRGLNLSQPCVSPHSSFQVRFPQSPLPNKSRRSQPAGAFLPLSQSHNPLLPDPQVRQFQEMFWISKITTHLAEGSRRNKEHSRGSGETAQLPHKHDGLSLNL